jgi:hypothetical protein
VDLTGYANGQKEKTNPVLDSSGEEDNLDALNI